MEEGGPGVAVSVWKAIDPPKNHHNDFKVDVGNSGDDDWVCIGGGGTGHEYRGNYLTASFPSDDFKSWNIHSRDHLEADASELTGYAIALRIEGLSKDELISNLRIFKDTGTYEEHPARSSFIEDEYVLLGGGFHVIDQPSDNPESHEIGGNMSTGSFPDSNISWRASSMDFFVTWPSRLETIAIGIRSQLRKADGFIVGSVTTMYHSFQFLPGGSYPESTVKPLPGMVLCGGGAAAHYNEGMLIWSLEPTPIETNPPGGEIDPTYQSFTGRAKNGYNTWLNWATLHKADFAPITAYAMGMKFEPAGPWPFCINKVTISDVTSSGNKPGFGPENVIDPDPNTKWWSTNISEPYIKIGITPGAFICRVDVSWADGDTHKYRFRIIGFPDIGNPSVIADTESTGTTKEHESYTFTPTWATVVKIDIIESTLGATTSEVQISNIAIYNNG